MVEVITPADVMPIWDSRSFAKVAGIDPATGDSDRSCHSAIVTVGWNKRYDKPSIWVLDARQGRGWKGVEILENAYAVHMKYICDQIWYESIGFQDYLSELWVEKEATRSMSMPLMAYRVQTHGRDKGARLAKTARFFRERRVKFNRNCPMQQRLIEQILTYKKGEESDLMDAFCIAVNQLAGQYPPGNMKNTFVTPNYIRHHGRIVGVRR